MCERVLAIVIGNLRTNRKKGNKLTTHPACSEVTFDSNIETSTEERPSRWAIKCTPRLHRKDSSVCFGATVFPLTLLGAEFVNDRWTTGSVLVPRSFPLYARERHLINEIIKSILHHDCVPARCANQPGSICSWFVVVRSTCGDSVPPEPLEWFEVFGRNRIKKPPQHCWPLLVAVAVVLVA